MDLDTVGMELGDQSLRLLGPEDATAVPSVVVKLPVLFGISPGLGY